MKSVSLWVSGLPSCVDLWVLGIVFSCFGFILSFSSTEGWACCSRVSAVVASEGALVVLPSCDFVRLREHRCVDTVCVLTRRSGGIAVRGCVPWVPSRCLVVVCRGIAVSGY